MSLNYINNQPAVSAGATGILAVGGNVAAGSAPTVFPLPMGGIDTSGKTQRILTDTSGRIQLANSSVPQDIYNNNPLSVQDTSIAEDGSRVIDLLTQILLELRIANQQRYEFNFGVATQNDEPSVYRSDPTMFNN